MNWFGSCDLGYPLQPFPHTTLVKWPEDLNETGIFPTDPTTDGKVVPEIFLQRLVDSWKTGSRGGR
jgi:hypothetical protein